MFCDLFFFSPILFCSFKWPHWDNFKRQPHQEVNRCYPSCTVCRILPEATFAGPVLPPPWFNLCIAKVHNTHCLKIFMHFSMAWISHTVSFPGYSPILSIWAADPRSQKPKRPCHSQLFQKRCREETKINSSITLLRVQSSASFYCRYFKCYLVNVH